MYRSKTFRARPLDAVFAGGFFVSKFLVCGREMGNIHGRSRSIFVKYRQLGDGFHLIGTAISTLLDTGEWGTLLIEFDMDDFGSPPGEAHTAKVFINDKPDNFKTSFGNHGIAMPSASSPNRMGSSDTDTDFYSGCIEKIWFSIDENLDLTVPSNRLKFYNADLAPKDLGSTV